MPEMEKDQDWKKTDNHAFKRLMAYAKPYWAWFLLVFSLIFVAIAMRLVQPRIIQTLIDQDLSVLASPGADAPAKDLAMEGAIRKALIYLAMVLGMFVINYLGFILTQKTAQRIIREIRSDIYNHILGLSMKFFDDHAIGSLVTRATNDPEAINEMFTYVLVSLFQSLFTFAGIVIIMYSMDARLATFVVLLTPFIVAISVIFRRKIRVVYKKERETLSLLNTKLSENLSGIFEIQTFNEEEGIYREFDEINQKYYRLGRTEILGFAIYRPTIEIVRTTGLALLLWFGGLAQMKGLITFGLVYAFIDYIQQFFRPILEMAMTFNVIQYAMTSANRVFHLLDQEADIESGDRPLPRESIRGAIEFDHVWFRYDEEGEWILKDVSFTVEPGQFVAFVGATGAGKSTIMSLISRFYDVQKGRILLDGVDVKEYQLTDLRRAVGLVQQDVFLFTGDIIGNIRVGRESVDREAAYEAAKLVRADEFIKKLPKTYDEPVTERGSTLSAGQRQLLSFARTVADRPPVLILDEATSNIDTETETLIQEAIQNMSTDRTMLAVAHRISTIAGADKIIVMHHGKIAEEGTREELIEKNGLFRVLYDLQYAERV